MTSPDEYPKRRGTSYWIVAALLACVATAGGCGDSARRPVHGDVTLAGQPLDGAAILFVPLGDTPGGKSGTTVREGRYELVGDDAPAIGRFRVEIWKLGRNVQLQDGVAIIAEAADSVIPANYNSDSTLKAEVTPDGNNRFDFHLLTKP